MDLRIHLFYRINFAVFLYFTCYPSVASDQMKTNMLDAIVACDSFKFLHNSEYANDCSGITYPLQVTEHQPAQDLSFMCQTLQHITKKICEHNISNKTQIKLPETAEEFGKEMNKFEPTSTGRTEFVTGWCKNSTSFFNASIQNDTNLSYVNYVKEILMDETECLETCEVRRGVNHFCMVFFWLNKLHHSTQSPKSIGTSTETAVSRQQVSLLHSADDNSGKQALGISKSEHESIVNKKSPKEQSKSSLDAAVESNNMKLEPVAIQQEIKKDFEQPELDEKDLQKQDSKLSSSIDNKLNVIDNKMENPKSEFSDGDDDFMAEERKKTGEDGAEGDHEGIESIKKDPFSDLGDQRSGFESPIAKEEDESHFFIYFSIISFVCVALYVGYHNKQKILAMALEGRQSRRSRSSRRRPNTANYRKLDSNLEEAVTSQCNSNVTHVIY